MTAIAAESVDASGRDKRSIIVHHRIPAGPVLNLMLSLCPGCHAKIHRTKAVLSAMPPLLLELWREQHPQGHEQKQLDFSSKAPAAKLIPLFTEERHPAVSHRALNAILGISNSETYEMLEFWHCDSCCLR